MEAVLKIWFSTILWILIVTFGAWIIEIEWNIIAKHLGLPEIDFTASFSIAVLITVIGVLLKSFNLFNSIKL